MEMLTGNFSQVLDAIVNRLLSRFDPDKIILFGSQARETAQKDSDIDLLVVLPKVDSRRGKQVEMRVALHDLKVPLDVVVVTPDQLDRERSVPGTLVRAALLEGRVLYARTQPRPARRTAVGTKGGKRFMPFPPATPAIMKPFPCRRLNARSRSRAAFAGRCGDAYPERV